MATFINKNIKLTNFGNNFPGIIGKLANPNPVSSPDTEIASTISNGALIPLFRYKDNAKFLPTYNNALQRTSDEFLTAEDLDNIQLELETLLSNVAMRARVLKSEYENVDKDEKRNDRRMKEKTPNSPAQGIHNGVNSTNGKRKRDELLVMRKKHSSMTIMKQQLKHTKNSPLAIISDDSMDYMPQNTTVHLSGGGISGLSGTYSNHGQTHNREYQLPKMTLPKNDMPNKFWLSVEPYCMPLTNEDLRLIDDLIEQYKGPIVPMVPPLGPHYACVWANEDIKNLQNTSSRLKINNSTASSTTASLPTASNTATVASMLTKGESMLDETITGPLTQRLVSTLIEEQMIAHPSEQAAVGEHSNSNSSEITPSSTTPYNNLRTLSMLKNCVGIEKRVKKELLNQGILDMDDFEHDDDDEVLYEIKRVSTEINSVAQFNCTELKQLRTTAANEVKRMEIKRKLDVIDQEILECYKRTLQYRAKRKTMTIEEQQEVFRLTSEQRALADQLKHLQYPNKQQRSI